MPEQVDVSTWFDTHTYRADQFDAATLVAAKGGRGISVLIPAKDEAATIGPIVTTLRTELMQQCALVDEIIVIDSHSADDTAAIARDAGAQVFHVDDLLPELGGRPGKGEAMWKALAVMSGDIGVYLDADVEDFTADFVTGLVGPLLLEEDLAFVKAFYDRPWSSGPPRSSGGGRVTELVARPLILERAPRLAGFVQPLAGECAFRADVLRSIPFVSHYGVDIGLMIDVERREGLAAMAQVDLGLRRHRHQDLAALSAMTQHVRAAFDLRAEPDGPGVVESTAVVFARVGSRMQMSERTVTTAERPPMRDVLGER
ncbi:glucosyl-3-phosphoglycerate synthase [Aeromicrobium wangtongii]|uniref:Glucosyl-3-phosphoglycerate synthase n=1 Tax=Aeromicrobium wangtongii TaxID=2969247 RepID=A0ABY5MCL0_9ACTN|nr:glucosyl-3-phosphoglycerate synthase [Aeromicrobium wangtongii]UUP14725.1 glucosyl-3-phosphoglycerate synthase [Aeromicrobium wangtongii]